MPTQMLSLLRAIIPALFLMSCSQQPLPVFQSAPPPNPDAPLAFFGEGNVSIETQREYAAALQNSGIYNFVTESFSEEQIKNAIEIRLNYSEDKVKFGGIPTLILKAELLKDGFTWFNVTIKETSNKNNLYTPRSKNSEKKFRKQVLLERFLEEAKRASKPPEPASKSCRG
jgi:hypothetical protein